MINISFFMSSPPTYYNIRSMDEISIGVIHKTISLLYYKAFMACGMPLALLGPPCFVNYTSDRQSLDPGARIIFPEEMESFSIDGGTIKGAASSGGINPRGQDINADQQPL